MTRGRVQKGVYSSVVGLESISLDSDSEYLDSKSLDSDLDSDSSSLDSDLCWRSMMLPSI